MILYMKKHMPKKYNIFQILKLILAFLGVLSFVGAVVYRLYALDWLGVIISLILSIASFAPLAGLIVNKTDKIDEEKMDNKSYLVFTLYLLLSFFCFYILYSRQTSQAIISPWQVVPDYFFIVYGIATFVLIISLTRPAKEYFKIILLSLHYLLSFSVAIIVYKIGYGYDPFVHEATLKMIDQSGFVDPKPFYYLGQYSLIIIAHKILFIPIAWINKMLVPILASLFLPYFIFRSLMANFNDKIVSYLATLAMLAVPFSFFIITTPQSLAFLFLILIILISFDLNRGKSDLLLIYILSLAAFSIQPIAGLPALIFSGILTIPALKTKYKNYIFGLFFLAATFSLPASFFIFDSGKIEGIFKWSLSNLSTPGLSMPWKENFIYNFVYLYDFNLWSVLILLISAGLILIFRQKKRIVDPLSVLGMSIALFASYLITKNFSFNYLIAYERGDFPERILAVSVFFAMPLILYCLYSWIKEVLKQDKFFKFSSAVFLSVVITASLYLSYPRYDKYSNAKGFSTGEYDIEAVNLIRSIAGKDYIVLANQQVSAAALHEFGFDKYYTLSPSQEPVIGQIGEESLGEVFYYPVPTSGPLYQYYLDMVYKKPSRETMLRAINLAGVDEGYFVLNKYWWAFSKVRDEAKLEADALWEIGQGDIYIYKYKK